MTGALLDAIDLSDVRMIQRGQRPRFALEARESIGIARKGLGENLQRDVTTELRVAGASKAVFIALVLSHGGRFLGYQAAIAVFVDALWVMMLASYLLAMQRAPTGDETVGSTIETV